MPDYTILIMKRNETDRRPLTFHISSLVFWLVISLAVLVPVLATAVAVGWVAPAWLKLDFHSMENRVAMADKTILENEAIKRELDDVKSKMDGERAAYAEAETKLTMAETARAEATTKLTQMESEMIALKQSVATYEQLLKPKLDRELLQCVNLEARVVQGVVQYGTTLTKLGQNMKLPSKMTARVRVIVGDNAMAMQGDAHKNMQVSHDLNPAKGLDVKGTLKLDIPPDTTRLLDVKVFDESNKPVGYCWKTF
jgi:hypothetical protein